MIDLGESSSRGLTGPLHVILQMMGFAKPASVSVYKRTALHLRFNKPEFYLNSTIQTYIQRVRQLMRKISSGIDLSHFEKYLD